MLMYAHAIHPFSPSSSCQWLSWPSKYESPSGVCMRCLDWCVAAISAWIVFLLEQNGALRILGIMLQYFSKDQEINCFFIIWPLWTSTEIIGSLTQVSVCINITIPLSALLDPSCVCLCDVWASFLFGVCNGDCVSKSVSFWEEGSYFS